MPKLSNNIWIFDGESVPFLGLPFSTRMTVVRLSGGDLWIHSPIRLTDSIKSDIDELGSVKYLIAPNHLHHLFIQDWQSTYPGSLSYGTSEVIKKRDDLEFAGSLNLQQPWPWSDEIDQINFTGSPLMEECVFFHKSSKVLILTDLIENFSGKNFNCWQTAIAKVAGIMAPNGKTPLDWRLSFIFHKAVARNNFATINSWSPQVVVMSHGEVVEDEAQSFLQRSFRWLK